MRDVMQAKIDRLLEAIVRTATPAQELLVPVSGGSDSAFVFWLLNQALPGKIRGIHAPSPTLSRIMLDGGKFPVEFGGAEWFAKTGLVEIMPIDSDDSAVEEDRWSVFLSQALAQKAWLVGSRNRTEDELGTYSLASRVATYLPIVGVWKSEVMRLCKHIGVPKEIIASSSRADPNCGRPQELAVIPFEYVEIFLQAKTDGSSTHPLQHTQIRYLESVYTYNRFKAALPLRGPKL